MAHNTTYPYVSLTAAITDKTSPLRTYFETHFADRTALQSAYRSSNGPLRIDGGDANPGTLGAAFDFVVRMVLDPNHVPRVALIGFIGSREDIAVLRDVVDIARQSADCRSSAADEALLRACWTLALCTEVYRVGLMPESPIAHLVRDGRFSVDGLLHLATTNALVQLQQLHDLAVRNLYPTLPDPARRTSLGPTFDGSRLCAADADVIIDGLLLEVKTRLGTKNKRTGVRSDTLSLEDIYQLLGYALFDRSDKYAIDKVGIYSARYGSLTTWSLDSFLGTLAGRPVDLAAERESVWRLLGGA
jgi:hypothetical protein